MRLDLAHIEVVAQPSSQASISRQTLRHKSAHADAPTSVALRPRWFTPGSTKLLSVTYGAGARAMRRNMKRPKSFAPSTSWMRKGSVPETDRLPGACVSHQSHHRRPLLRSWRFRSHCGCRDQREADRLGQHTRSSQREMDNTLECERLLLLLLLCCSVAWLFGCLMCEYVHCRCVLIGITLRAVANTWDDSRSASLGLKVQRDGARKCRILRRKTDPRGESTGSETPGGPR